MAENDKYEFKQELDKFKQELDKLMRSGDYKYVVEHMNKLEDIINKGTTGFTAFNINLEQVNLSAIALIDKMKVFSEKNVLFNENFDYLITFPENENVPENLTKLQNNLNEIIVKKKIITMPEFQKIETDIVKLGEQLILLLYDIKTQISKQAIQYDDVIEPELKTAGGSRRRRRQSKRRKTTKRRKTKKRRTSKRR
jgi:hypothetical protein